MCRDFTITALKKNIKARFLIFAGYIHNHKILPGNIFGFILKNKIAAKKIFSTFSMEFCWPSRTKGIIGRDLKFAGYVHHYKILTGNIFGLILKNKMAATGVSLSVKKSAYITLIIGPRGLESKAYLWGIMSWESSDAVRFGLGPLLQGQTRIAKVISAYNSLIISPISVKYYV